MLSIKNNIKIAGISGTIPKHQVKIKDLINTDDKARNLKIKRTAMLAGLNSRGVALENITIKNLAISAGTNLLQQINWDPSSINMLFFITQTPDFLMPGTSYLIHHGLQLSQNCIATDITASCSGLIHGAQIASMHISPTCKRILILSGDIMSKIIRPEDIGNQILFGDGVGAIALEYSDDTNDKISFNITTYPDIELNLTYYGSGLQKSDHPDGFYMFGEKIMEFSGTKTVENINQLLDFEKISINEIEKFFFHQPNKMLLEQLATNLNISMDNVPMSIENFANCSSANIGLLLSKMMNDEPNFAYSKALFCGFGGGLEVASMLTKISHNQAFPTTYF